MQASIVSEYFQWLFDLVCEGRYSRQISYRNLLTCLHDTSFRAKLRMDRNRAEDGIDLRYRFAMERGYDDSIVDLLDSPCSVLEMMIALAIRCEESIMDDPDIGDRTADWFWGMVNNMGLGSMHDDNFDRRFVEDTIFRFLDRKYEPDGKGGLFTIRHCDCDLRTVEIWYQLCWYLDSIT